MIWLLPIMFAFCGFALHAEGLVRKSSAPYISGDTFRTHADFIIDDQNTPFFPQQVKQGNVIFLKTDYMELFFEKFHPLIKTPYVLITHNSAHSIPGPFASMLEDEKIIAWFGQNTTYSHPKLHPIPVGLANQYWPHGNTAVVEEVKTQLKNFSKIYLLYLNFTINTCFDERSVVQELFVNEPYCFVSGRKNFRNYLIDLAHSKFVLSPRGMGLDCHRIWETLYMGSIPIVRTSLLDPLFEDLPVLIVNDWSEITQEFLEEKYEIMSKKVYNWDKLTANYWLHLFAGKW